MSVLAPGYAFAGVLGQQQVAFDPVTDITWHSVFDARDVLGTGTNPSNGAAVSTWANLTGESDATQGAGSAQPTFRATGMNSQPSIEYAAGDSLDTGTFTSAPSYTSGVSIVVVADMSETTTGNRELVRETGSGLVFLYARNSGTFSTYAGSEGVGSFSEDLNTHLWVGFFDGSTGNEQLWIDGSSTYTGNAGSNQFTGIMPGADWRGDIAFVGIYEGSFVDDANYSAFTDWVTATFGITIS